MFTFCENANEKHPKRTLIRKQHVLFINVVMIRKTVLMDQIFTPAPAANPNAPVNAIRKTITIPS
jgi:hypothetical protein